MKATVKEVLRYGEALTDIDIQDKAGNWIRVRTIIYDHEIYYLVMENGEIKEFENIGFSY